MKILISNGSNNFYLTPLAAELHGQGYAADLLTSGWPTPIAAAIARPFAKHPSVRRFFNRRDELPPEKVHPSNFSEVLFQIGIRLRWISAHTEQNFDRLGFAWYAAKAGRVLRRLRPEIYHYRSCYGLGSVPVAKKLGIPAVCDHSIAHPGVAQYMVANQGRWPKRAEHEQKSPLSELMRRDIHQADAVVVNSDFVKDTCVFSGVQAERIHVVYTGLTKKYLGYVPHFDLQQVRARVGNQILFAGGVQRRKGVRTLANAYFNMAQPPMLRIIGDREREIQADPVVRRLFDHPGVESITTVSWPELARRMSEAPIFVFPSYCEGSARVIFEAMACGCFIITTPNSGSIVRDSVHGFVVPSGDAEALAAAMKRALDMPDVVARIGWRNSQLVRESYRQDQYAERVLHVYRSILTNSSRNLK